MSKNEDSASKSPPCYRSYEAAQIGRPWESFTWLVQHLDAGNPVDQLVTDSDAERDRLVAGGIDQGYGVAVWRRW